MREDVSGGCLVALLVVFLFKGGIGYLIGKNKGQGVPGFFLGLFLSFIGWIITACLPPFGSPRPRARIKRRRPPPSNRVQPCPHCGEKMRFGATFCRDCQSEIAT